VGQLQLCGDTVVTGSSDCSIRVWSLLKMAPIQRIAAAEKAVTSLQVDHHRIISGSIDGTVRVWDRSTGELIRELGARSDRVWRVYMSESMAIIVRSNSNKLMLEVKDSLSHRPLQLLTHTRSGHFHAMISQDRATKVALLRVALMRIMIMVLHEMDFSARMSTPPNTLAHVRRWRLTFDEGGRKRNRCSSQESQMYYHCTVFRDTNRYRDSNSGGYFRPLTRFTKGLRVLSMAISSRLYIFSPIFSTLIFLLLLEHRFESMGLNLGAFAAQNRPWLKLILASGYPASTEIMW
jgi:WD40 repeat protein